MDEGPPELLQSHPSALPQRHAPLVTALELRTPRYGRTWPNAQASLLAPSQKNARKRLLLDANAGWQYCS